jgi:hypothetical protein
MRRLIVRSAAVDKLSSASTHDRALMGGEQLLDLPDGLGAVPVPDRVYACLARTGHGPVYVVEEDHLLGLDVQAATHKVEDPRNGFGRGHE